jgi:hypothetical protein
MEIEMDIDYDYDSLITTDRMMRFARKREAKIRFGKFERSSTEDYLGSDRVHLFGACDTQ